MPTPRRRSIRTTPVGHLLAIALVCSTSNLGCNSEPSAPPPKDNSCPDGVSFTCQILGCARARYYCVNDSPGDCTCLPVIRDAGVRRDAEVPADASIAKDGSVTGTGGTPEPQDSGTPEPQDSGTPEPADSGTPGAEICDNGIDDDSDGETDCSDEDCSSRSCIDDVPVDWQGPVALGEGSAAAPACAGHFSELAEEGGADLNAAAAQCSRCACSAGTCSKGLSLTLGTAANCSTQGDSTTYTPSACNSLDTTNAASDSEIQVALLPVVGETACTPGTAALTGASPSFDKQARTCGLSGSLLRGGCERGRVCAPTPEAGFGRDHCIVRKGDHSCPSGSYSNRHIYYAGISDTRSCTACDCSDGCSYEVTLFNEADTSCNSPVTTLNPNNACTAIKPVVGSIRRTISITDSGGCGDSGGQASGEASGTEPFTVCCL